jgi:sec-independent protein translocase protein TatB
MAAEFQSQFQEALREAEMADLKKEVEGLNDAARGFTSSFDDPLSFKEETKSDPKPDTAKLDTAKLDTAKLDIAKPDTAKPDDIQPDDATKPAGALPESPPAAPQPPPLHAGDGAEEAFALAAEHTAVAPAPIHDAASAQQVTPPAAESLLPEGSSQRSDAGSVHS